MRPIVAEMQKPRLAGHPLEVGQGALSRPRRVGEFLGNPGRRGGSPWATCLDRQPDVLRWLWHVKTLGAEPIEVGYFLWLPGAHRIPTVHEASENAEARISVRGHARVRCRGGIAD